MKLNEILEQELEEIGLSGFFGLGAKEKKLHAKHGNLWNRSIQQLQKDLADLEKNKRWLPRGSKRPGRLRSIIADKMALAEADDSYKPPTINVGDEVRVGRWKNRKAEIKGFKTDDKGQPVLKTTKGDQKLFKPRITKLMPKELQEKVFHQFWDSESSESILVHKNPSSRLVQNLLNKSKEQELRGLLEPHGDLIVWDAYYADHFNMSHQTGFYGWELEFLSDNKVRLGLGLDDDIRAQRVIKKNKNMQRAYDGKVVFSMN